MAIDVWEPILAKARELSSHELRAHAAALRLLPPDWQTPSSQKLLPLIDAILAERASAERFEAQLQRADELNRAGAEWVRYRLETQHLHRRRR